MQLGDDIKWTTSTGVGVSSNEHKYSDIAYNVVAHAIESCKGEARPLRTYYYIAYAGRYMLEIPLRHIMRVTADQWKQAKELLFNCEHKDLTGDNDE